MYRVTRLFAFLGYTEIMQKGKDYIGVGVGAFIFNGKGEVLFMKRGQASRNERGHWDIPGGGVRLNETREQAVIREVKEEFGLDVEVVQELHTIDHMIPDDGQHWVTTPFVVRVVGDQEPAIMEPAKCEEITWFHPDNLPSPLATSTIPSLAAYQRSLA
jgi:8-oxo-dGTP diphosphatase